MPEATLLNLILGPSSTFMRDVKITYTVGVVSLVFIFISLDILRGT